MQQTARRATALLLVFAAGQSCVLEPLDANRVAPGGSGGESAGSPGKAGSHAAAGDSGSAPVAGASSSAGTPAGGSPAAAGSAGAGGVAGNLAAGGAADAGAAGEPAVDWIRCDPTFAYEAYVECPTIQPSLGEFCDPDIFYPTDFCAYCQDPSACPVDTAFVVLQCVNRAWRVGTGTGIGCCPDAKPPHGSACDSSAYCEYGVNFDFCECLESKWQCCADAYDGDACDELGKECLVNYGEMDQDRCSCAGSAPANASWTCCPVFPPHDADTCFYEAVTCVYPDRTCNCATSGSMWSCN